MRIRINNPGYLNQEPAVIKSGTDDKFWPITSFNWDVLNCVEHYVYHFSKNLNVEIWLKNSTIFKFWFPLYGIKLKRTKNIRKLTLLVDHGIPPQLSDSTYWPLASKTGLINSNGTQADLFSKHNTMRKIFDFHSQWYWLRYRTLQNDYLQEKYKYL